MIKFDSINLTKYHYNYIESNKFTLFINNNTYNIVKDNINSKCNNLNYISEDKYLNNKIINVTNYSYSYNYKLGQVYTKIEQIQSSSGDIWFPPPPINNASKWKPLDDIIIKNNCTTNFKNWLENDDSKYQNINSYDAGWIPYIENINNIDNIDKLKQTYKINYSNSNNYNKFTFSAGKYTLNQQLWLPPNTIIEGILNPNSLTNPRDSNDINQLTIFEGNILSDLTAINYPTWIKNTYKPNSNCLKKIKQNRIGFLMNNNTVIRNFIAIGNNSGDGGCSTSPYGNKGDGGLCGGGIIELPGCATEYLGISGMCGNSNYKPFNGVTFPSSNCYSGAGRGINNVLVENLRLNTYTNKSNYKWSWAGFWSSQAIDNTPHTNITLRQIFCATTERDSINIHGRVENFVGEDLYFENSKDDSYAVWGVNDNSSKCSPQISLADNIHFNRVYAIQNRPQTDNPNGTCAQIFGSKKVTFTDFTCCYSNRDSPGRIAAKANNYCTGKDNSNTIIQFISSNPKKDATRAFFNNNKCPLNMQQWGAPKELAGTFKCKPSPPGPPWGSYWGLCTPSKYNQFGPAIGCTYSI